MLPITAVSAKLLQQIAVLLCSMHELTKHNLVWCSQTQLALQGWSWVEEGWVVDTQGIADDAVDQDGWSYATDFGWLRMPPAPNSGKFRKVTLSTYPP